MQPSLVGAGGARPPPFTLSTITSKVVVYAPICPLPFSPLWVGRQLLSWEQPDYIYMTGQLIDIHKSFSERRV
jgi:hypothetical protein